MAWTTKRAGRPVGGAGPALGRRESGDLHDLTGLSRLAGVPALGRIEAVVGQLEELGDATRFVGATGDTAGRAEGEGLAEGASVGASGRDGTRELLGGRLCRGKRRIRQNDGELVAAVARGDVGAAHL